MNREELLRVAHSRLYPALTNPNYLVLRSRRLILAPLLEKLPDSLSVLDVGGRYQPYRPLLGTKSCKYYALDLERTELVDVVGSGENIPFMDESFDLVIATTVFDYFPRPHEAAKEVFRVLRPGGMLLASVGAVVPRFGEEEYWRYLPRGLRFLFAPFSRVTITPEVYSLGGLCRLLNLALHDLSKPRLLKYVYSRTLCPILNLLGVCLEKAHLTRNDRWAGNYTVAAQK